MDSQQLDRFAPKSNPRQLISSPPSTRIGASAEAPSLALAATQTAPTQVSGSWRWIVLAIACLTAGGSLALPLRTIAKSEAHPPDAPGHHPPSLPVSVMALTPVNGYTVRREYTGEVKAARTSELGFERSGKLVALEVQAGERVTTGQVIARLDSQNLAAQRELLLAQKAQAAAVLQELQKGPRQEAIATAQFQVAALEDQLALQQTKQGRRETLYQAGAIAREDLDEVAFEAKALGDRLAAARSQLQELQTGTRPEQVVAQQAVIAQLNAQLADLDITIEKSQLRVPYSGIIGDRLLDEGTVVGVGQAVVRLVEGARPEVEIGIPERIAADLVLGSLESVEIGGQTYPAELKALKPEIDAATRTRPLVLQLDASALKQVAPQQIARLKLEQTVATRGYWLPITALVKGDRGLWSAYAVVEARDGSSRNIVERRDLEVLYTEGERALVRGTVEAGDRIIQSGVQRIVPGQRVLIP